MKSSSSTHPCALCGAADGQVRYAGPIRSGMFGELTAREFRVIRCGTCDCGFLEPRPEAVDYAAEDYRTRVDGAATVAKYYELHDREQPGRLARLPWHELRGEVVADVGSGAGSFLDLISGVARATIAIEPSASYHAALRAAGHAVFTYCSAVSPEWQGQIDTAVCFSVIEHVEDPVKLLSDIGRLLTPGGRLILSTPNSDDWMLDLLPDEYGSFFHRVVHPWYFSATSLEWLARAAGYKSCEVSFVHRFDLSNLLLWLRDRRPTGTSKLPLPQHLDAAFRSWLESHGKADYLYATLRT